MAVSPRVLWGNVASAVNGAATMIAAARPDLAGPAAEAAAAMLRTRPWPAPTRATRCGASAAVTAASSTACRPNGPPTAGTASWAGRPRSGHVREYAEDRLAVLVQLGVADAVDPPSSSSVEGGEAAISRRVASWKITYGGMPSSLATDVRHARNRSNTGSASGGSSAGTGRPAAPPSALAAAARLLRGGAGAWADHAGT